MKKIIYGLLLAALPLFMIGCGSGGNSDNDENSDSTAVAELPRELANGTTLMDLSEYYMPFSLYIPDSSRGIPEIIETGYGETIVKAGSTFNMIIAEGGDLQAKKAAIADDLMYTNTIVNEGDGYILYKSEIKDSFLDPEFHFYAVKTVNGVQYEFRDNKDEGPFAESVAKFMLESTNHIVPNKKAS